MITAAHTSGGDNFQSEFRSFADQVTRHILVSHHQNANHCQRQFDASAECIGANRPQEPADTCNTNTSLRIHRFPSQRICEMPTVSIPHHPQNTQQPLVFLTAETKLHINFVQFTLYKFSDSSSNYVRL